jgi:hypothetical protein
VTDSVPRKILNGILVLTLALGPASARAMDPLVLFLLKSLRDQFAMSTAEYAWDSANRQEPPKSYGYLAAPQQFVPPGSEGEEKRLRALIDRSFTYLTADQREQVLAGLMRILSDPQNAAMRPQIVESFTQTAEAVRSAQQALNRLSTPEKQALVVQARSEYLKYSPEERRQMVETLRAGQLPLPRDLTEMMLAEFPAVDAGSEPQRHEQAYAK